MHEPQQHFRRRRRTHHHQNRSLTILYSISWYVLLSATFFIWGAYNSLHSSPPENHHDIKQSPLASTYSLAYYQSYGFFDDISTDEWQRLRSIEKSGMVSAPRTSFDPHYDGNDDDDTFWNAIPSNLFYGSSYDPNFSCRSEVRVGSGGSGGDGPKFVCDPFRIPRAVTLNWRMLEGSDIDKRCLVYSIGCGGNFRFEAGLQELLGTTNRCEIHVFDGTDYSARVPKQMDIHFHNWGLRRDRGPNTNDDYTPDENLAFPLSQSLSSIKYMSLSQTMKILGHTDRVLDILKIDCEGCEWKTFLDWLGETIKARQVLIEVHRSPAPFARNFFNKMKEEGYVIFHKEPNLPGCPRGDCIEYGFLKLHPDFFD
mmetsp:Transcript_10601/g.17553  ORF Transcript_10601/g.17553 Transcript_10601/m.17553 type:complete len:369 (-) Transcript_10601:136-1242(-)